MEEELKLELNNTYLIRYGISDVVSSITILLITDKAYHVRWNRGTESNDTWELKTKMCQDYTVVENISDFVVNVNNEEKILNVKTKLIRCYVCHGMGTIPSDKSTAGSEICPCCLGAKMIPDVTEIS